MSTALLDFTKPHVLRSEAEYEAAIAEIERLLDEDVEAGSEGYDRDQAGENRWRIGGDRTYAGRMKHY